MSTPAGQTARARATSTSCSRALQRRGYTVVGPTVQGQAIVYGELRSSADLPVGWTDEQEAGHYRAAPPRGRGAVRLQRRAALLEALPAAARACACGSARRDEHGGLSDIEQDRAEQPRYAFIGARSCELHAMGILDRVLLGGTHPDPAEQRACARTSSSSRCSARRPAAPASAPRWAPGRPPRAASTSR